MAARHRFGSPGTDLSAGKAYALDSIRCGVTAWERDQNMELWVENPTAYGAVFTILADSCVRQRALSHNYFGKMQKIYLGPGQRKTVCVEG